MSSNAVILLRSSSVVLFLVRCCLPDLSVPSLLCSPERKALALSYSLSPFVHPAPPPPLPVPVSFSRCLPAGRIKCWVFMSGPESSLSSPLTVPMATSSSVAADGGCLLPGHREWRDRGGWVVGVLRVKLCWKRISYWNWKWPITPRCTAESSSGHKDTLHRCDLDTV